MSIFGCCRNRNKPVDHPKYPNQLIGKWAYREIHAEISRRIAFNLTSEQELVKYRGPLRAVFISEDEGGQLQITTSQGQIEKLDEVFHNSLWREYNPAFYQKFFYYIGRVMIE